MRRVWPTHTHSLLVATTSQLICPPPPKYIFPATTAGLGDCSKTGFEGGGAEIRRRQRPSSDTDNKGQHRTADPILEAQRCHNHCYLTYVLSSVQDIVERVNYLLPYVHSGTSRGCCCLVAVRRGGVCEQGKGERETHAVLATKRVEGELSRRSGVVGRGGRGGGDSVCVCVCPRTGPVAEGRGVVEGGNIKHAPPSPPLLLLKTVVSPPSPRPPLQRGGSPSLDIRDSSPLSAPPSFSITNRLPHLSLPPHPVPFFPSFASPLQQPSRNHP